MMPYDMYYYIPQLPKSAPALLGVLLVQEGISSEGEGTAEENDSVEADTSGGAICRSSGRA